MEISAVVYIHNNYRWHFRVSYKQNNEFEYTDMLEKTNISETTILKSNNKP